MAKQQTHRALLINPPVYDFRLDWARWHQPCGLLQVGSFLKVHGHDVRLIDCLQPMQDKRVQRTKLDCVHVEGAKLWRWHFGWSWERVEKRIEELKSEEWEPDTIYVTGLMTFWWESSRDLVDRARTWFPKASVILGGVYPSLCPQHVKRNIRKATVDFELAKQAKKYPTDFGLYQSPPQFAGISLHRSRSATRIVDEIETKSELGVREYAFFDSQIPGSNPKHFENVLDLINERRLSVNLRALGNIPPRALNKSLILKMRQAGFRQIYLQDTLTSNANLSEDLDQYGRSVELLTKYGGYKARTEDITAMVVVGVPGENLEQVTTRLTHLAHIVGSVNLVPYQPTPGSKIYEQYKQYLPTELEKQNGKLFPFAQLNFAKFSDYQELTRLAALLNSKYRSTTFDFLGDDQIGQMVRQSIALETWKPKVVETLPLVSK